MYNEDTANKKNAMEIANLIEDNYYIYGFGVSGKWLATILEDKVLGFIDSDEKKAGRTFLNIQNYSPQNVGDIDGVTIIVAVVDIQDVLPTIQKLFPNSKVISMGQLLNNQVAGYGIEDESEEFVSYSLRAVEICHDSFLGTESPKFMRSLDIVISTRCSLKCQDCSNLMQYYKNPTNITFEEVKQNIDILMSKIEHIYEVRVIGGEPFMNNEAYEIINFFINHSAISKVVVYTNATIPFKTDKMKGFGSKKLVFFITDYGSLSKNTRNILSKLDEIGVAFSVFPPRNWTDSGRINHHKRSDSENQEIFNKCCGKNLYTLMGSRIYRCPFSANCDKLSAVPKEERNSVEVTASPDEITKYLYGKRFIPACDFCNGRSFDAPEIIPAIQTQKPLVYKKYQDENAL
jgi:organic radical activating enzyme